jgi:cysteine synthase A
MMGSAPAFVPETLGRSLVDEFFLISRAEAFAMCRQLAKEEGLLAGVSSGEAARAGLTVAGRPKGEKVIACYFADRGHCYVAVEGLIKNTGMHHDRYQNFGCCPG